MSIGSRRFFAALASSVWILATACGGATSAGPEDAGSSDTGGDGGHAMPCNGGPVTFHMRAAEGTTLSYCVVGGERSRAWLSVTTERSEGVAYELGCQLSCEDCRSGGCILIGYLPQPLMADGERLTWDGRVWVSSTCGNQRSCGTPTCATPGKYVAKMCARPSISTDAGLCSQSSASPPTCVEVEFEYPTATTVEGVLP